MRYFVLCQGLVLVDGTPSNDNMYVACWIAALQDKPVSRQDKVRDLCTTPASLEKTEAKLHADGAGAGEGCGVAKNKHLRVPGHLPGRAAVRCRDNIYIYIYIFARSVQVSSPPAEDLDSQEGFLAREAARDRG